MGRIKKSAGPKHDATLPPALAAFVKTASELPLHQLRAHLSSFSPRWPFPRGDLYNWIPLLNRFDHVLDLFNLEYSLKDGPQTIPFGRRLLLKGDDVPVTESITDADLEESGYGPESDRELVEAVLAFSTLLLENCGNRSLYSSSGQLNDLLNTTSLSLLIHTLRLGVRCAQRYLVSRQRTVGSAQHHNHALLASHYNINLDKVLKLALPFSKKPAPVDSAQPSTPATPSKGKEKARFTGRDAIGLPIQATDLVNMARGDEVPQAGPNTASAINAPSSARLDRAWDSWGDVSFTYFPTTEQKKDGTPDPSPAGTSEMPNTPTPIRRNPSATHQSTPRRSRLSAVDDSSSPANASPSLPNGKMEDENAGQAKMIEIPYSKLSTVPIHELSANVLPEVPSESRYDLANRLRIASALTTSADTRRQILGIRILAITNLAYIQPEPTFQQKILQQDSDEPRRLQLAYQLADLVHPTGDEASRIPRWLQTLALSGLEALAKHKSKVADVCAALSVNVNHGVLLYVVRKAVAEMANDGDDADAYEEDEWRDALFSLLSYLPETARTGEALVSAGLLPILLEVLSLRTNKAERNHPKVLLFLDTFVYHMRDAFQTLANARGLDIISDLTAYEVESGFTRAKNGEGMPPEYRNHIIDYEVPFFQQQTLRWLFKFVNHMMSHGGGNFDRLLRNLIDSPQLLGGLRTILSNAKVFGSNVWSGAVNILSNFIHNEPTSYAVIAEAGLSKSFLEAVTGKQIAVPEEDKQESDSVTESADQMAGQPTNTTRAVEGQASVQVESRQESTASQDPFVIRHTDEANELLAQMKISRTLRMVPVPLGPKAQGILPSTDAILTVPQAFGAICLNSAGMRLFKASNAPESFFEIFVSPDHVKSMHADDDLPNILGSSFDELVRHHPPLKEDVMVAMLFMLVSVGQLCRSRAQTRGVGAKLWVLDTDGKAAVAGGPEALAGTVDTSPQNQNGGGEDAVGNDVADMNMAEADDVSESEQMSVDKNSNVSTTVMDLLDKDDEEEDPSVSMFLDVTAKFLNGFFSNASMCSAFIEMGGAEWLLDLVTLPSLQYDFNNLPTSQSLSRVVHLLVEQKPHLVLPSLVLRTQAALAELKPFLEHDGDVAFFKSLVELEDGGKQTDQAGQAQQLRENVKANGTVFAKSLVKVHTLCCVLRETFSQPLFSHRSSHTIFTQVNLADVYATLVEGLGALHRACVWEEILLQKSIPDIWNEATRLHAFGASDGEANKASGTSPETRDEGTSMGEGDMTSVQGTSTDEKDPEKDPETKHKQLVHKIRLKNVKTLRYLLSQIPLAIIPFFQGLGRVLVAKRQFDTYQRQNAVMVAEAIARAFVDQLERPPFDESSSATNKHAFWIVMLTSLSQLMIEIPMERPQPQSLTLVLQAFKNMKGFEAVKGLLTMFLDEIRGHAREGGQDSEASDASARIASAYHGIKIILAFFSQMVTSKNITEASQTTAMASRDRDKDKPDYFSPNQFLVELRVAVLPVVRSMWDSDIVDHADSLIAKSLINILRTILEGDHEGGAYKRSDKISRRAKAPIKLWRESTEQAGKLVADGFDLSLVREALYRCNNNVVLAEDYCKAQKRHDRAIRLFFPERETSRRSSRPQVRLPSAGSQAANSVSMADVDDESTNQGLVVVSDDHPILENLQMEIEEAGTDPSPNGSMPPPPPPPAPAIPAEEESVDNAGALATNIDSLLGNLRQLNVPTPPLHDRNLGNGNEGSNDTSSASPSRDNGMEVGKMPEIVTIDDLEEMRVAIRANLIDRSLDILNVHSDVTFELADLIMAAVSKATSAESMRGEIGETLVQSLMSLQLNEDFRPAGKKIAAYANLLGQILQDKLFYDATLGELRANLSTLLGFIKTFPDQPNDEPSPWIGQILLIIEKLLAEDAQPRPIKWTPPTSETTRAESPVVELEDPVVSMEQKSLLFDAVVDILPRVGKDESLAVSVARALVMLTRTRPLALRLGERRNLQRLFVMVKQLAGITTDKLQGAIMIILRQVIEDDETLKRIMQSEIKVFFESRQSSRQLDTNGYVRSLYHLVLRAPETFVEVSNEMLKLVKFDVNQRHQILALKDQDRPTHEITSGDNGEDEEAREPTVAPMADGKDEVKPTTEGDTGDSKDRPKTPHTEIKAPTVENPDGIIHYLLGELLSYKDVDDKEPSVAKAKDTAQDSGPSTDVDTEMANGGPSSSPTENDMSQPRPESKKGERPEFKAEQHPIYIYRCFILQCLTELLSCYNRTKIEFINFSRKAPPHAMTPSKPRSGVLNYLLNDVIPVGTLNHAEDIAFRKKYSTSNWAIAAVVALCSKTGEKGFDRRRDSSDGEDEPDLLFVRKFVLEHALKAYRDASASSESLDTKYARLLSLSDLFNRMLTGRPISGGNNASAEMIYASQKQLARIMFEKNYIAALTSSIADIDLNFPSAKRAVKYILRPLKQLTQTAIELSESASISTTPGQTDEDEISSATSVSEMDDREETPDLFRNSTLGMFEPGREQESSSDSSDDDEAMYDDEYGEEMDYDEEAADEDDVVSDEDEEIGHMEGLPGEIDLDVEVVLNGDEQDTGSDDEDDEEDEDDEDDEDDGEDIEIVDEINGDGENESGPGDEEEGDDVEWQSEDDDQEVYEGERDLGEDEAGHNHHDSPLEHIVRALEGDDGGDMLQQLEEGELHMDLDPEGYMEDPLQDDEDDEDDDDDLEEDEEVIYERELEEDAGFPTLPWGWNGEGDAPIIARGRHHNHHRRGPGPWSHFLDGVRDSGMLVPTYRSHRPVGGTRGPDDGTNPLLQRRIDPSPAPTHGRGARPDAMTDWISAMESGHTGRGLPLHDSPVSLINNLINAIGQGGPSIGGVHTHHQGGALHFHIGTSPFTGNMPREIQAMLGIRRPQPEVSRPTRDDPATAVNFVPSVTSARWQEEARILFGGDYADKTHRVINALLSRLVPPAIEEERERREKAVKEARKAQKEREEQMEEARVAKEKAEKAAQEKREEEERLAAETAAAEPEAGDADVQGQASTTRGEDGSASEEQADEQAMEGVESSATEPQSEASGSRATAAPAPRVHTTLRGRNVDITDLEIDPEYLDALPEELREEVLMHQYTELQSQRAASGEQPTDLNPEFLEALPDEIREELLEQEAQDRRRREREEARRAAPAGAAPPTTGGEDMDPATVLATLDPGLRQAILMEQDEDVLAQLPQALAAEARALGGEHRLRHHFIDPSRGSRVRGVDLDDRRIDPDAKKPQRRTIVQMLDKAGVATLLRLMFIPQQGSARQTLNGILQNVCENRQTRHEVVTLLLSILQDGSADTNAVERSFAHLSLRARQAASQKTPQAAKRTSSGQTPPSHIDMSPLMVIQQCLSSLVLLVHYNQHIPLFFLTEHDASLALKRGLSKKGKGKDNKASRYALNSLLGLLDRKLIMESSSVMEQLSNLLNSITHPLTMLLKKDKDRDEAKPEKNVNVPALEDATAPTSSTDAPTADNAVTDPGPVTGEQGDAPLPDAPAMDESAAAAGSGPASEEKKDQDKKDDADEKLKKPRSLNPPVIPEHNLRLVVNILAARECSAKTFRDTLSTINNLSAIPEAKEVFGRELLRQAQELGQSILNDLTELIPQIKKAQSGTDVQGMALAKFSPASSDQAKLLRVLTALDYLFDAKKNGDKDKAAEDGSSVEGQSALGQDDLLGKLYENSTFGPLWTKLSECLSTIRQRESMLNVATILLPLIEALMVVCKNTTLKNAPVNKSAGKELSISSPPPESSSESLENLFFNFTEEHRKILNDLVRHNPKLMSGTFSLLVKNPKVLEFDNKRNYFTRRLHSRGAESRHSQPPLQLSVRRDHVFLDSFKSLYFKSGDEMKYGKLSIRFHGEEGVDAGGVTREWFQALSRQMFNPDYALFTPVASDRTTFHPNRLSAINPEHFMFFKFIGRIIGKALYEGRVLDCHFSRAVYKRILGKPVSVKDMETLDLDYYKSLRWMLENDITDIITETFAVESEAFGESQIIDLKENGRNIPVTEENKQDYVRLVVEYRLTVSIQEQLEHFLRGFHDIVPAELIAIFNEQELELLISGLPDIDVDDWKNNTEYHNYSASSAQIQWFWRAVRSFDKEERAKLLQFVTGTSKVPLNGFKELEGMNGFSRFNIHRDYGSKDRLPSSHTCFNQLDLPEYESYEALRQQVYTAMTAGSEYFGFA